MISSDEEDAKNAKAKGKEKGKERAKEKDEMDEGDGGEEVKENVEGNVFKTYVRRLPRAQQRGKEQCATRVSKPPPVMDIIEWTPAPKEGEERCMKDWGSVEV